MQHSRQFILVLFALLAATACPARAVTIAALGDSYTNEYNNVASRNLNSNWVRQLGISGQGIDFGSSNPWIANYPLNFAFSGATTNDALLTQLPNLLGPNGGHPDHSNLYFADYVVIDIGLNDYLGLSDDSPSIPQTYIDIGSGNAAVTQATIGGFGPGEGGILGNIKSLVDIILAADPNKRIIMANIVDWGATRPLHKRCVDATFNIDFRGTAGTENVDLRRNVRQVVKQTNNDLAAFAQSLGIPLVNKFRLMERMSRKAVALTAEDRINFKNIPDLTGVQGGAYDLWADGLHPGTAFNGLYANAIIAALNYYGEDLDYLTSQQIIGSYLGAADLPDLPLHPAWDFNKFIITPPEMMLDSAFASLISSEPIPEPGVALLLLVGAPALNGRRRRC